MSWEIRSDNYTPIGRAILLHYPPNGSARAWEFDWSFGRIYPFDSPTFEKLIISFPGILKDAKLIEILITEGVI